MLSTKEIILCNMHLYSIPSPLDRIRQDSIKLDTNALGASPIKKLET